MRSGRVDEWLVLYHFDRRAASRVTAPEGQALLGCMSRITGPCGRDQNKCQKRPKYYFFLLVRRIFTLCS
jgi:hypothetical protein